MAASRPPHPAFPQPADPDTTLWRYMDLPKFSSCLEFGRLYMPTAAEFRDDLEGTVPSANAAWWEAQIAAAMSDEQRGILASNRNKLAGLAGMFGRNSYISCWRMDEAETPTMWPIYTSGAPAVAIKTTCAKLRAALPGYVEMGMVTYIDYATEMLPPMANMYTYLMHKDAGRFRIENEFRAIALPPHESNPAAHAEFLANFFEHPNTGTKIYAPAIRFSELVDALVMHPEIDATNKRMVRDLCPQYGLPLPSHSAARQR